MQGYLQIFLGLNATQKIAVKFLTQGRDINPRTSGLYLFIQTINKKIGGRLTYSKPTEQGTVNRSILTIAFKNKGT